MHSGIPQTELRFASEAGRRLDLSAAGRQAVDALQWVRKRGVQRKAAARSNQQQGCWFGNRAIGEIVDDKGLFKVRGTDILD